MDGKDGPRARRDPGGDLFGVDVERAAVAVGKDRRAAAVNDRVGRGAKGHRRGDDFVTRTDARGQHGQVERGRAGIQGHRVLGPNVTAEILLELMHARAGADPPRPHGRHDLGDLVLADRGAAEDEELPPGAIGRRVDFGGFQRSSHHSISLFVPNRHADELRQASFILLRLKDLPQLMILVLPVKHLGSRVRPDPHWVRVWASLRKNASRSASSSTLGGEK